MDVVAADEGTATASLSGSTDLFLGGRPRRFDFGVGCALASDSASSVSLALEDLDFLGVLFIGVATLRLTPAVGMGVPFDLRGLPLFLGVVGSSSSLNGTVVVVVRCCRRTEATDDGDWKSLRLVFTEDGGASSVSTVTRSF